MTPQVGPRTRALMLCLTVICLSLLARPATATVISYTFDPGSEFNNSAANGVSGTFTFDTTTHSVTGGPITINGSSPVVSTVISYLVIDNIPAIQVFFNNTFADSYTLSFTPAIGNLGTLEGALFATTPPFDALDLDGFSGSVTGTSVSPVPEPSSIVLLIPVLGLFLLRKWRPRLPLARTDPQASPP